MSKLELQRLSFTIIHSYQESIREGKKRQAKRTVHQ
jgi:hypothetical protein